MLLSFVEIGVGCALDIRTRGILPMGTVFRLPYTLQYYNIDVYRFIMITGRYLPLAIVGQWGY